MSQANYLKNCWEGWITNIMTTWALWLEVVSVSVKVTPVRRQRLGTEPKAKIQPELVWS